MQSTRAAIDSCTGTAGITREGGAMEPDLTPGHHYQLGGGAAHSTPKAVEGSEACVQLPWSPRAVGWEVLNSPVQKERMKRGMSDIKGEGFRASLLFF